MHYPQRGPANAELEDKPIDGYLVLIKGSRGIKLETVIGEL